MQLECILCVNLYVIHLVHIISDEHVRLTTTRVCFSPVEISHSKAKWSSLQGDDHSETAVFIEPTEGAVTRVSLRPNMPHQIICHRKWLR